MIKEVLKEDLEKGQILHDNDWTLEKYLHKVWWEDKGYED